MKQILRKLSGLWRQAQIDAELREEMQTHLEMKEAAGGDPLENRRQFGNSTRWREDSRAAWGWPTLEAWLRDFRYALRTLRRERAFAATVVLTLALGIGASSTIYSVIDTVLIRPLPYPDSDRLVALSEARKGDPNTRVPVAPGRLEEWQQQTTSFDGIAGSIVDNLTDSTNAGPERLRTAAVSPRFFAVIQTPAALGRVFTKEEENTGGAPVVVISDGFWKRRFGGDPAAIGKILNLKGQSFMIVGVMPARFQYPDPTIDLWIARQVNSALMRVREARFYAGVARLKPEISLAAAGADLAGVQRRLGEQYPQTDGDWATMIEPLKDRLVGRVRAALWLLFGSATLLLLIACANVACLLLARLSTRGAEIATRCSLGAGSGAVARQLFVEGLVFSLTAGFLGAMTAFAGVAFLRRQLSDTPRVAELTVDVRMLGGIAALSLLAAILLSLAPIVQTFRRDLAGAILRSGRALAGRRQRLPRILASAQLALATALLIGAGLFLRSLLNIEDAPLGYQPEHVLTLHVGASFQERSDEVIQRHRRLLSELAGLPGVTATSMSAGLAGVNPTWPREFVIQGESSPDGNLRFTNWRVVTSEYFITLGIPIRQGRTCRMETEMERGFEVLVNRSFVQRHFPDRSPLGRVVVSGPYGQTPAKIVGIVEDAREEWPGNPPQPLMYACGYLRYWADADFLVQTRNPASMAAAVQAAVRASEPSRPVYAVRPMEEALHGALAPTRFRAMLISGFSAVALLMAAIGLYGVMAYMVSQRTREIGIRMALGARPGQIVGEILRSAGTLAGIGVAAGVVLAAGLARTLGALLYGVAASDAVSYILATCTLFGVALLACVIPSRRATSVDPTEALRQQ